MSRVRCFDNCNACAKTGICGVLQPIFFSSTDRGPAEGWRESGVGAIRRFEQHWRGSVTRRERTLLAWGTLMVGRIDRHNAPVIESIGELILGLISSLQCCICEVRSCPAVRAGIDLQLI